jgi:hypothetical protein
MLQEVFLCRHEAAENHRAAEIRWDQARSCMQMIGANQTKYVEIPVQAEADE